MTSRNVSPSPEPNGDLYAHFLREDAEERRGLRKGVAIAVAVHAAVLMITFPQVYPRDLEPSKKQAVYVIQQQRFKKPDPPIVDKPKIRPTLVPVPDPTPDDPEPLRLDDVDTVVDLPPIDDDVIWRVPEAPPEPEIDRILQVGGDVTRPERTYYVAPQYSEIARRVHLEGTVILQTIIDREGQVTDVQVLKGMPMGLTEASVDAVRQWRFAPATLGGKPVAVYYNLTVIFDLKS